MANSIDYVARYLPLMDEKYVAECKTSILENNGNVIPGSQENEFKVAKLDMDALGDFDRKSGYTEGNTSLTWETIKCDKERSQTLRVDRLDNQESMDMAYGKLSSEFMRTKVAPETDAARISKIASTEGISTITETIADGASLVKALRKGTNVMDEDEVYEDDRVLLITPTLHDMLEDMDTTKSKEIKNRFSAIIKVPAKRMYKGVTLKNGKEDAYGFSVDGATPINFMIVDKGAVAVGMSQYLKYFTPDQDQIGDSHVFKYRNNNLYGYVFENKVAGVYVSFGEGVQG